MSGSGSSAPQDILQEIASNVEVFDTASGIYDAFARLRVSNPTTLFESKLIVAEEDLLWHRGQYSGAGGTFLYTRDRASARITQAALSTGRYVRRTKKYFNYQPGKSQLVIMTCIPGPSVDGVDKRFGYFDEDNGVFFGVNGGGNYLGIRSHVTGSAVDSVIWQADWNLDKLDGTGPSGVTLDTERVQIYWIDFEWLGAGRVRFGIFYRGRPIAVHQAVHSNEAGNASVYMSTPVLPLTFEVENDGTGAEATLEQICCTVVSEGGTQGGFITRYISRGATDLASNSTDLLPVLSMRARDGFEFNNLNVASISVGVQDNADFEWQLILNPTVAGTDAASWVPVASSTAEYDISRTDSNTLSGGTVLDGGYVMRSARATLVKPANLLSLGKKFLPTDDKDELVLAVRKLSGATLNYLAGITYEESI